MKGTIFNIQRFCVNDGPGIRTTVFLKGCPLNCAWCHNPESKIKRPQIMFDASKCVCCGRCASICKNHFITDTTHKYLRENCTACGNCTEQCLYSALESAGYETNCEKVLETVMRDNVFYKNSGGGVTLSGGEPMAQPEFTLAFVKTAKEHGLHVCMETCGHAPAERFAEIAPYVDIFLFDYKLTDSSEHKKYTGVTNELILSNLFMLDALGAKIILRCPIIPTVNDCSEHFLGIAETANKLKNIIEINIEPYHPLGRSKSEKLGKDYPLAELDFPANEEVEGWIKEISAHTKVTVKKA